VEETRHDRAFRYLERFSDLLVSEFSEVTEREDLAITCRELIQRSLEELRALLFLDAGRRARCRIDDLPVEFFPVGRLRMNRVLLQSFVLA